MTVHDLPETVREMRKQMRKRPGMWIGGTDSHALHHMLWAAMDHMVEEAIEGHCNDIRVELRGGSAIVSNNGPGLPATGAANLTDIMLGTEMRPAVAGHYYGVQGGLHGLSLSIVNHLSEMCFVKSRRPDGIWHQSFDAGIPAKPVQRIRDFLPGEETGLTVEFKPDREIFGKTGFGHDAIANRLRDLSYLIPGVTFTLDDQRSSPVFGHEEWLEEHGCKTFHTRAGLRDWIWDVSSSSETVFSSRQWATLTDDDLGDYTVMVDVAFQFGEGEAIERSFINTVETRDGGSHRTAMQMAVERELSMMGLRGKARWRFLHGFIGGVHVLHPQPLFEGRTRMRIRNTDIIPVVRQAVRSAFSDNPAALSHLTQRIHDWL